MKYFVIARIGRPGYFEGNGRTPYNMDRVAQHSVDQLVQLGETLDQKLGSSSVLFLSPQVQIGIGTAEIIAHSMKNARLLPGEISSALGDYLGRCDIKDLEGELNYHISGITEVVQRRRNDAEALVLVTSGSASGAYAREFLYKETGKQVFWFDSLPYGFAYFFDLEKKQVLALPTPFERVGGCIAEYEVRARSNDHRRKKNKERLCIQ